MRIALIAPLYESVPPRLYGGTERVVAQLAQGLTAAGIETTVFASGDSQVSGRLVPVVPEALRLSEDGIQDPAALHLALLATVARQAREFDLIHNHHDYWMLPLTGLTDVPVVTTLHGKLGLMEPALAFRAWPKARYISISHAQRQPMPDLPWVRTIHHGLDYTHLPFRGQTGKYLAFLGRITRDKGPAEAIRMAQLSGVPLKIAAKIEGPGTQEYFDAEVKPHIDGKNVEFIGEISDREKGEFLGDALALAFPIDWPEPFGLVMIEAMACGTPVLARPRGSVPEVVQDGVTGFIRESVDELAQCVHRLPEISRAACRTHVERRFSLARMTEETIDVYQQLIGEAAGERSRSHRRNLLHSVERSPF